MILAVGEGVVRWRNGYRKRRIDQDTTILQRDWGVKKNLRFRCSLMEIGVDDGTNQKELEPYGLGSGVTRVSVPLKPPGLSPALRKKKQRPKTPG